ncbi:flavodoxin family protein [Methanosphaerula palustris]|uniref:Flavodoxin n=1 Tax=Methanosphaerula palustris (strain ATCC BAA-1556 / DSM 19958 / E1-9c) TaxID=521011 RepID=B8GED7_METPE|nr:flavodoxin family protein [Methanosphaerula palustris]ACL17638.1 flavodoxin [Methanosphaerula palustris E1-9c]
MKVLIVYQSMHHGNTRVIAEALATELYAECREIGQVKPQDLEGSDLIGFGSGIYFGKHHQSLIKLAERMQLASGQRAFIFSTAGLPLLSKRWHRALKVALANHGVPVCGEFCSARYDTYAIFGVIGGIHRGRPDQRDVDRAVAFAKEFSCR